jgi:hypothetical protein
VRVDRNLLGWGIFFVLVGAIPLAVRQGLIPSEVAWWQLWPLILVGLGLALLLRRTPLAALGGLVVAATAGLMAGGALASGFGAGFPGVGIGCIAGGSTGDPFPTQTGELDATAQVVLEIDCGEMRVEVADGNGWSVSGTSDGGQSPVVASGPDRLEVRTPARGAEALFQDQSRWDVALPSETGLDIEASVNAGAASLALGGGRVDAVELSINAGDGRVDLTGAEVGRLAIDVNAGKAVLILPSSPMNGTLEANAGSVDICAPAEVALRIVTDGNITVGDDFAESGLVEVSENVWQSPDWESATTRIELETSANAASFSLDPEGDCRV